MILKEVLGSELYKEMLECLKNVHNKLLSVETNSKDVACQLEWNVVRDILEKKMKELKNKEECWNLQLLRADLLGLILEMDRIVSSIEELNRKIKFMIDRFEKAKL